MHIHRTLYVRMYLCVYVSMTSILAGMYANPHTYCTSVDVCLHWSRSPGGTPMRTRQRDPRTPDNSDPAAIIARALQKKFSHLIFQDSPNTSKWMVVMVIVME